MIRSIPPRAATACAALALTLSLALTHASSGQSPAPAPTAARPRPVVDVYVIAGQSNAMGRGRVANLQSGQAPDPRAWLYHSALLRSSAGPFTWAPLRPASETREMFGPEVSLGSRLQERTPDRPVALIKHAATATNLVVDWNPGKDGNDRARWGHHYQILVGTVEAGLQALRDKGFEPNLRGMAWQQGETDSEQTDWALGYAANLSHFIARVRDQFHAPDMVFVYGFVLPPPCQGMWRDTIRTAQGAIDQDSGSPFAVKRAFTVFTDDLNHRADDPNTTDARDYVHIGSAGQWELGRRMAETMANKGKTTGR